MFHGPAQGHQVEDRAAAYKTRLGIWLFLVYLIVYSGFVAINVISPALMAKVVFMGLNLAVAYGLALIVFALILALVYNHLCTRKEAMLESGAGEGK